MPQRSDDVLELYASKFFKGYATLFADVFRYLRELATKPPKPNFEAQLAKRFKSIHEPAQSVIAQVRGPVVHGSMRCLLATGGLQHNTVNRLLLMSSSESHLSSVPMAFFFSPADRKVAIIR
jgi:hypothetical protein